MNRDLLREILSVLLDIDWGKDTSRRDEYLDEAYREIRTIINSATREAEAEGYKKGYIDAGIKALTEQSGERDAD